MVDNPITRKEKYLAKLTGSYTGNIPDPITRVEKYLYDLCQKGISGLTPEEIENAVNKYLKENPVQPGATTEQAQQIEQNKVDIASLKTETSSLKEDISTKITKFYASSQGETHLADSDNGKIQDMMLYGKSEQKRYSGKNLLNATLQTTTVNGVTCTANGDGTYTLNGTATTITTFDIAQDVSYSSFRLAGCPVGGAHDASYELQARTDNLIYGYDTGDGKNIKADENFSIRIRINTGINCNNLLFKPMIVDASLYPDATYDDFEPYTGGIPSPNPDYPQEIKSVVNPTVKVCGKNLIPPITYSGNVSDLQVDAKEGLVRLKGTPNAEVNYPILGEWNVTSPTLFTLHAGDYTVSGCGDTNNSRLNLVYLNDGQLASFEGNRTFTLDKDTNFVAVFVFADANKYVDITFTPMIEKGSTATSYEPYHEQTVTLPYTLNAIPVSSGGNVTIDGQQYIADYVDVERGKLVRMCKEYVITGSERLAMYWLGNASYLRNVCCINNFENIVLYDGINPLAMSDMFIGKISENADDERAIYLMLRGSGDKTLAIKFLDSDGITTVDLAKQWLIEHKPKTVFVLSTPEEIDLTSEEVQAFKALATYYPITNISINSEQLDGYTVLNYPISMENGWNYVKQQIGDTRDYIYDMDIQSAEAYVNSEYAVALTELEV
jgi:hypothetical protein